MQFPCPCSAPGPGNGWRFRTRRAAHCGHAGPGDRPARPLRRALTLALAGAGMTSLLVAGVKAATDPAAGDHRRWTAGSSSRPYAVVDKPRARISVHFADGRLAGSSAVLLGSAPGDHTVPGVGERADAGRLTAQDKTTPAGLFTAERGRNRQGETVIWLDYDAALAIHRLRPGRSAAQRAQALAQADAAKRRLSDGCVVVPGEFFDRVVLPLLGAGNGWVVVLPEGQDLAQLNDAH